LWFRVYVAFGVLTLLIGGMAHRSAPHPFSLVLLLMIIGVVAVLTRPVLGLYIVMFFTLIGDNNTIVWYPFAKNMSSLESIFFVDDAVIVSPLEVFLVVTTIAWLLNYQDRVGRQFRRPVLLYPLMGFTFFVLYGYVQGMRTGGDRNVALWEMRPLLYVPLFYLLITQLFSRREQYVRLFLVAMGAVFVHAVVAINYFRGLPAVERAEVESLGEHGASIHIDAMLLLVLALLLIKGCSPRLRVGMLLLAIPCLVAYAMAERRAAVVALVVGIIMFSMVLHRRRRRAFWWFVPIVTVVGSLYLAAFWGVQGSLGFPAQAVKSVIAPGQLSEADASSDMYRLFEKYNIWYTIRTDPVRGLGFGRQFYQPIPLPDISFFVFWRYLPHNSILWIWIKMGFFGFVAMLYLFARTVQRGAITVARITDPNHLAFAIAAVGYVIMYIVFAYVDIAWDARATIFLAFAMAWCADFINLEQPAEVTDDEVVPDELDDVGDVGDDTELEDQVAVPS
jgi:O-antigen ligase